MEIPPTSSRLLANDEKQNYAVLPRNRYFQRYTIGDIIGQTLLHQRYTIGDIIGQLLLY
jgi:hypothetical protein